MIKGIRWLVTDPHDVGTSLASLKTTKTFKQRFKSGFDGRHTKKTFYQTAAFGRGAQPFTGNLQKVLMASTDTGSVEPCSKCFDNGSTLGVKAEHEIAPVSPARKRLEFEFAADSTETPSGIDTLDEAYIGVKGGFGSAGGVLKIPSMNGRT